MLFGGGRVDDNLRVSDGRLDSRGLDLRDDRDQGDLESGGWFGHHDCCAWTKTRNFWRDFAFGGKASCRGPDCSISS